MDAGQRFSEILEILCRHHVDFIVVGATAAVLDGAPITTWDLDVLFEPSVANCERLLAALAELDAVYLDPMRRKIRPTLDRLQSFKLNLLETRLGRLDLLRTIGDGLGWDSVLTRSHLLAVAHGPIRVLDLDALIEAKEFADRDKDRATLPLLRETLRLRRLREGT